MPDVVTLGELLVDFVPTVSGVGLIDAPAFKKAAGGAPANVAAGLARLGISAGFMGKVGDDAFGHFLARTLEDAGVDSSRLRFCNTARTALAFVSLRSDGEREFMFYRHPSADMLYAPEDVDDEYIRCAKVLHYGSVSLIGEPSRGATLGAVETAKRASLTISYDPNLRLSLWPDAAKAKEGIMLGWPLAEVIKVSEEELAFLSGTDDLDTAVQELWHADLRLLVITRGKSGCRYVTPRYSGEVPGFRVKAVDSTGAGDGFVAGLLKGLIRHPSADQNETQLAAICRYANAVGALTTTERGAIPALPDAATVESLLQRESES